MTPEEAATWQAYAGAIQAGGAILALAASVVIPLVQKYYAGKIKLKLTQGCLFADELLPYGKNLSFFTSNKHHIENNGLYDYRAFPAIEIENKSSFPVVITDIGVAERKKIAGFSSFFRFCEQKLATPLPVEVPPFQSVTVAFSNEALHYKFTSRTIVYVSSGTRGVWKEKACLWAYLSSEMKIEIENHRRDIERTKNLYSDDGI
ncbi:hypothetical protein [Gluconobacter sp.]|uniref:hypothetical protein n=1 Tax=Gluconobacter sp. TaxID=1876758 RepID=UPI0039EB5C46